MSKLRAKISGIHGWVPPYILTNKELETMVETTDEWIMTRTGIRERHILKGEGLGTSDMGAEAVKGLLEKIKAETISEDFPRLRVLAYPLSKVIGGSKKTFKEAYFGWIKFEADAEAVVEFKKEVEKLSNVLGFLIIKTVKENTLYGNKFAPKYEGKPKKEEEKRVEEPKGPINEEEIDKTIEDLVIE